MGVTFNRQAGVAFASKRVAAGLDRGLDVMLAVAIKEAPVRKTSTAKPRQREERAKAERINRVFAPIANPRAQPINIAQYRANRAAGFDPLQAQRRARVRRTYNFDIRFVNTSSGNEETNVGFTAGKRTFHVRALGRGGNLRSKIRRTPIEPAGSRFSGKLISGASYSKFMEFGFIHVGGKKVTGKSFMRPAIANYKANWQSYFKGTGR